MWKAARATERENAKRKLYNLIIHPLKCHYIIVHFYFCAVCLFRVSLCVSAFPFGWWMCAARCVHSHVFCSAAFFLLIAYIKYCFIIHKFCKRAKKTGNNRIVSKWFWKFQEKEMVKSWIAQKKCLIMVESTIKSEFIVITLYLPH